MKKIILRILFGVFMIFVSFIGFFVIPYFANIVMPWDRANAIEAAVTWGGLAELPESADIISVNTEGNMFTRTFIVEFKLGASEIENWIKNSKRLMDATYIEENNTVLYEIYPGEGKAVGGTVTINKKNEIVVIYMSWS